MSLNCNTSRLWVLGYIVILSQCNADNTCDKETCSPTTESMASRLMRAIWVAQFGGPEVLKIATDVPVPKPQDKQVLIKTFTVGVNPVDTYIRTGTHNIKPPLPYTPGMDAAGVVEDVGTGVTKVKKGDRVYCVRSVTGTYAEYTIAEDVFTFKLHEKMNFSQGAAIGVPYFTSYRSLFTKAKVKPGESVLIHGASGGVGSAACQMARAYGCTVYGTAGTPEGMCLAAQNGAHHVFNHREEGYINKIMEATNGKGVDVILEMLANQNLENDLQLLAPKGRVVIVGSKGKIEITPRLTMGKETQILGMLLTTSSRDDWEEMGSAIGAGMEAGWLKPVVGQEFPLDQASAAHIEVIEHKAGTKGKVIMSV